MQRLDRRFPIFVVTHFLEEVLRRWVASTEYGCDAWRRFCRAKRLDPSMSRTGNCGDNAAAESFLSSLKKERVKKQLYKNRQVALADIADYIETFYNSTRRHSHPGGISPNQFERAHKPPRKSVH